MPSRHRPPVESNEVMRHADQQQVTNPRTGKIERVFVNLDAVYPKDMRDINCEMSFEELRAKSRGWFDRDWAAENRLARTRTREMNTNERASLVELAKPENSLNGSHSLDTREDADSCAEAQIEDTTALDLGQTVAIDLGGVKKASKGRKMKVKEVRGETQTSICSL